MGWEIIEEKDFKCGCKYTLKAHDMYDSHRDKTYYYCEKHNMLNLPEMDNEPDKKNL